MSREAIEEAIEVLEDASAEMLMETGDKNYYVEAIAVLRQALVNADDTSEKRVDETAKQEHEPVAFINVEKQKLEWAKLTSWHTPTIVNLPKIPLYTAPPKREWVGLTEREVELIDEMIETQLLHAERCDHMANSTMAQKQKAWDLERVELLRKLKEKNT